MFWIAFISIILFILFLIVVLVTTGRSSTDKTLRTLKDDLEEKTKLLDDKKKKSKVKKEPKKRKPKPKVIEVVEELISKETLTATEEPQVKEEVFIQEEVEEVLTPPIEVSDTEPEETKVEVLEKPEEILEEPEIVKEDLEVEVEPSVEEIEEKTIVEAVEPETEVELELPIIEEVIEVETTEVAAPTVEEKKVVEETLEVPVKVEEEEPTPEPVENILPYEYAVFDNARTMEEFGLSKEEADEFIVELITQVEDEMPALEAAVEVHDAKKIEDISHMVKGSATNLGVGGIANVLIDFNTYMKSDNDPAVVSGHMNNLRRALKELKEQFQ